MFSEEEIRNSALGLLTKNQFEQFKSLVEIVQESIYLHGVQIRDNLFGTQYTINHDLQEVPPIVLKAVCWHMGTRGYKMGLGYREKDILVSIEIFP